MNSKCMYILENVHFTNSIKFDKTNAHKYEWNPCKCIEEFIGYSFDKSKFRKNFKCNV